MQRNIEVLIGRLITDEDFRRAFISDPHAALAAVDEWGLCLSHHEIAALVATDKALWDKVADVIDPRLQKASLCRRSHQQC